MSHKDKIVEVLMDVGGMPCGHPTSDLADAIHAKLAEGEEPVAGAVFEDGGVTLVRRGTEDERCRERGSLRVFTFPPDAQREIEELKEALHENRKDFAAIREALAPAAKRGIQGSYASMIEQLEKQLTEAREAAARAEATLSSALDTLIRENNTDDGPIRDTIWHTPTETLFDFMAVADNSALTTAIAAAVEPCKLDAELGAALRPNYEAAKRIGIDRVYWRVAEIDAAIASAKGE